MDAIVWDASPILLQLGPIKLRWYSLLFMGSILITASVLNRWMAAEGKPTEDKDALLGYSVAGTLIGARLAHCLFYAPAKYLAAPHKILFIWEGGLASHGGFIGIICAFYLFVRIKGGMSFYWLTDRCGILGFYCAAAIRVGNFFNSEIVGEPSNQPWAVIFSKIDQIPRHPAQLYEAIGYLTFAIVLTVVYKLWGRTMLQGRMIGIVFVLGYSYRTFIETFKENQSAFEQGMLLNMGQILSLPLLAAGIFFALGLHKNVKWLQFGFVEHPRRAGEETKKVADKKARKKTNR